MTKIEFTWIIKIEGKVIGQADNKEDAHHAAMTWCEKRGVKKYQIIETVKPKEEKEQYTQKELFEKSIQENKGRTEN